MCIAMDITLTIKKIGQINKEHPLFIIPAYQRGYRWTTKEVERLLADIPKRMSDDGRNDYCLQPVVVWKIDNSKEDAKYKLADGTVPDTVYELIDGQQRLTTLLIIQKMIDEKLGEERHYSIEYVTRNGSREHLDNIASKYTDASTETLPDFWFMNRAAEVVAKYIKDMGRTDLNALYTKIERQLEVIWYEVRNISANYAKEMFDRLNKGKIPLTNSELVKALFLREAAGKVALDRAEEISLLWDQIEIQLNDEAFWGFLTANSKKEYETRIDLILELIARDAEGNKNDQYHTFFYFDKQIEASGMAGTGSGDEQILKIWREIYETYLDLLGWYRNDDNSIFHLVGYLLGSKLMTLPEVYDLMFETVMDSEDADRAKKVKIGANRFKARLIKKIIDHLYDALNDSDKISTFTDDETGEQREPESKDKLEMISDRAILKNYSYEDGNGRNFINLILLLYNMIGEMEADEHRRRFPLQRHLSEEWTLEHIHARKSAALQKNDDIRSWLDSHIKAVKELFERDQKASEDHPDLLSEMKKLHDDILGEKADRARERYAAIYATVWPLFAKDNEVNDISNLALLTRRDNAALSNWVFEVKRQKISDNDADGKYIPWGTRRVFFKNFKKADSAHPHFWSPDDRESYVIEISETLKKLLK